ncbi:Hypothetical protein mma_3038 [Janthinobacterium sp. Marseille]|uniref:Exonuclease domain-containing protein n=2 Tax=Herminiimonas aquatilis TaxID=345342 RepID=A0ABW2J891_9BURK|nr:exonuclease domain-containing protein [Janthinobacterium sp. Marseille]ABR91865.1 Hypothetical protein mma_3038 [Janthinobacterium sp. Marseille]
MLIFLDTEFTGLDQRKPDLISIGLVDETGQEFYAELPEVHWTVQCNEWVHFNVLPHLHGSDDYVQNEALISESLVAWIENISDKAIIVTDCIDADFTQLKRLLQKWPNNLDVRPIQFTAWSMGEDKQPTLQTLMNNYYGPGRPRHHALHDAHALRLAALYAVKNGWQPENLD